MHIAVKERKQVSASLWDALDREYGSIRNAAKKLARDLNVTDRTARSYLAHHHLPRAEELIVLMRESDEVWATVCELACRDQSSFTPTQKELLRKALKALEGEG